MLACAHMLLNELFYLFVFIVIIVFIIIIINELFLHECLLQAKTDAPHIVL